MDCSASCIPPDTSASIAAIEAVYGILLGAHWRNSPHSFNAMDMSGVLGKLFIAMIDAMIPSCLMTPNRVAQPAVRAWDHNLASPS